MQTEGRLVKGEKIGGERENKFFLKLDHSSNRIVLCGNITTPESPTIVWIVCLDNKFCKNAE